MLEASLLSEPEDDFDQLLRWLAPDRDQAGTIYEQIRRNLFDYFRRRDVVDPLSLADEVIVRVTKRVPAIAPSYVGNPAAYFFAVAHRVLLESHRKPTETELLANLQPTTDFAAAEYKEWLLQSLEDCWPLLSQKEQRILYCYFVDDPSLRLAEARDQLAQELGMALNALRVMTHRLKHKVKRCIEAAVKKRLK